MVPELNSKLTKIRPWSFRLDDSLAYRMYFRIFVEYQTQRKPLIFYIDLKIHHKPICTLLLLLLYIRLLSKDYHI